MAAGDVVVQGDLIGIAKGDIDAEALPVELPGESALGAEPLASVLYSVVVDGRVLDIGIHFKGHEITEILPPCLLQLREQFDWRARHFQIDVLGCPGAFKPQFKYKSAFQQDGISKDSGNPCEEPIENQ